MAPKLTPPEVIAAHRPPQPIGFARTDGLVAYDKALAFMERRAAEIASGTASELVWLLQHPPLFTAGTRTEPADRTQPQPFPVHHVGRGGQLTYHGPGQRVIYVMLDLDARGRDIRRFVTELEHWMIDTLASLGVKGCVRDGRVGVWVSRPDKGDGVEDKIAAIGIRVRRWVSFHGLSLNVSPELTHYDTIVPCGISEYGVTSLTDLGRTATLPAVDRALQQSFERVFGVQTRNVGAPELDAERTRRQQNPNTVGGSFARAR